MSRQGPEESATEFPVGKRKRGNDGNMWQVVRASNGVQRWQRKTNTLRKSTCNPVVQPKAAPKAPTETTQSHNIMFCEPVTYHPKHIHTTSFKVNDDMYKKILKGGKSYIDYDDTTNAYVFGKRFPLNEYKLIGSHGNDVAGTGFIDLDIIPKGKSSPDIDAVIGPCYRKGKKIINWDSREAFVQANKLAPYVIFIGETVGGDVGANLYTHYTNNILDSIIIDNGYFFKDE